MSYVRVSSIIGIILCNIDLNCILFKSIYSNNFILIILTVVRPLDSDEQQLNEQLIEVSEIDYHIVNNLAGNVSLMQIVKCDKEEIKVTSTNNFLNIFLARTHTCLHICKFV